MQSACAVLYCHLWPVRLYIIFPNYLINGTIFEKKKITEHGMCVLIFFFHNFCQEHFSDLKTKYLNIKFHESLSSESRVPCGRAGRHYEADDRFSQFLRTQLKMETQLIRRFKVKVLFKYWIIVSDLFPILSRAHCFSVIQNPAV